MSFNNGPTVITNGLVLALDAGDRNSYNSGSLTWFDLTGTNNGTLTNGPTFNSGSGGSIVFDGVDDYVNIPNNAALNSNIGTVSIWFNYTSAPGNGSVILGKTDINGSFNGLGISIYQGSLGGQIKGNGAPTTNISGSSISTNTWYNYIIKYTSGVSYSSYLNGSLIGTNTLLAFTFSTQPLRLARSVDTYWSTFGGQIPNVQIYNRALSSTEVLQNYNATKGRFGL